MSNKKRKQNNTENNKIESNSLQTKENMPDEEQKRMQYKFWWKIFIIVFAVVCVGIIIYFLFIKDESHVKLGTYKGLTYTPVDTSVSDEEVEEEKERLINSRVTYEKLDDRAGTPVVAGDVVNCSYKASLNSEVLEEGSGNFEIGSGEFTDFEKKIEGKIIGDTLTISVVIPESYNGIKALSGCAGETVKFEVTINYASKKNIPELNNEFVSDITMNECQSVDAFDSYIRDVLAREKEEDAESDIIRELLDKVIANSTFKDMDGLVQEYYDTMYDTYLSAAQHYDLSMGEYTRQFYSMELQEFQKELKSTMVELVKEQLVLQAIVDKEKLKLSDERYNTYLAQYMEDYGYTDKEAFIEYYGADSIEESMLYDYAIDFIVENAKPES
ncbi:MAG: hypothetical protein ACI39R_09315 [Lachnospiraceae bacterium]